MYTALRATSQALSAYLHDRLQSDPGIAAFFGGNVVVSLNTPEEMVKDSIQGLSFWLYRVVRDEERLNAPPERISPTEIRPPPLPLRLHYLATPITNRATRGSAETEQVILGKVLQCFHDHSVFRGSDFPINNDFSGSAVELQVRLEQMSLEEITRVWEALEGSYQLSASYEVGVVCIESAREPQQVVPVQVAMPTYGVIVQEEPG